jgi:hypothetical protein
MNANQSAFIRENLRLEKPFNQQPGSVASSADQKHQQQGKSGHQ